METEEDVPFTNTPPSEVHFYSNDGAPGSGGKSFQISSSGGWAIFQADNPHFSGFEKGINDFEIWIKGASSEEFTVRFMLYENDAEWNVEPLDFTLNLDATPYWKIFTLEQFSPSVLTIPENIQSAQVIVIPSGRSGPVSVSTIKLLKKGPSLNLTAMMEGP